MPIFDITEKRPRNNIFKLGGVYYFKYFFYDPELFRELLPFYEKGRYRFKMATAGERNKVMKLLDCAKILYSKKNLTNLNYISIGIVC